MNKTEVRPGLLVKNIKGANMILGVVLEVNGDIATVRFSQSSNDQVKEVNINDLQSYSVTEEFMTDVVSLNQ